MDVGEQVMCPHTEHIRLTLERDEQFVDVAGGLLEYPIIYFFDPDADTERVNLDGAPLVLVKTWISFQGEKMYVSVGETSELLLTLHPAFEGTTSYPSPTLPHCEK
jgi:hypothetical protein